MLFVDIVVTRCTYHALKMKFKAVWDWYIFYLIFMFGPI